MYIIVFLFFYTGIRAKSTTIVTRVRTVVAQRVLSVCIIMYCCVDRDLRGVTVACTYVFFLYKIIL